MRNRRPTYRELEDTLRSITDSVAALKDKTDVLQGTNNFPARENESLRRRLEYYENPNSPPSADSLE